MTLRERVVALRTSRWFAPGLLAASVAWIALALRLHLDDSSFGRLTLFLSIEASVAASFLMEDGQRHSRQVLELLKRADAHDRHMVDLLEAQRDVLAFLAQRGAARPVARAGVGEAGPQEGN